MNSPPESSRPLFLVGFMGAGKTTVGGILAAKLGWEFIDLDNVIEARAGRSVAEIFAAGGESEFRRLESAALADVLSGASRTVIALGGGAFIEPANAATIREARAPVIFLDAPVEELRRRALAQGGARPLLGDENQFRQLYECRRESYMKGDLRVETGGKTPADVADKIVAWHGMRGQ